MDRRYWVVLDEISTTDPQVLDIRFHTYGTAKREGDDRWTFTQGSSMLDIVTPAGQQLSSATETPAGWIRPVTALNIHTDRAAREHAIVTVLQPRSASMTPLAAVRVDRRDSEIDVAVGRDRIHLGRTAEGWAVQSVQQMPIR